MDREKEFISKLGDQKPERLEVVKAFVGIFDDPDKVERLANRLLLMSIIFDD